VELCKGPTNVVEELREQNFENKTKFFSKNTYVIVNEKENVSLQDIMLDVSSQEECEIVFENVRQDCM